MSRLEKCDGKNCNKVTPNEKGLHIGNGWYEVKVQPRKDKNIYTNNERFILLCEDCYEKTGLAECEWNYTSNVYGASP